MEKSKVIMKIGGIDMSKTILICRECGCTNDLSDYINYMERKFNEILDKAVNDFHKEIKWKKK